MIIIIDKEKQSKPIELINFNKLFKIEHLLNISNLLFEMINDMLAIPDEENAIIDVNRDLCNSSNFGKPSGILLTYVIFTLF